MTKETYKYDFSDTPLCIKMEEIVETLWALNPEELTTNELIWFTKLRMTVEALQDDYQDHFTAITLMHAHENGLEIETE
jgi:hypothetical protein